MKSQKKQTKLLFGFALSMMEKAIEMQQAKNEFQDLKNEELRLKNAEKNYSVEVDFSKNEEFFSADFDIVSIAKDLKPKSKNKQEIDEKLKAEVENDPLFKMLDDIFNPSKNKKIIDDVMKNKKFPSGGIIVEVGKLQDQKPTEADDTCPCEACVLRRKLENRGFND